MKSFKNLIILLIIIVLFTENVNSCDSNTSSSDDGCPDNKICSNKKCVKFVIRV